MARQIVPAYVEIGKGNWVRVGQAAVDIKMGSADITLDDDAPAREALVAMMASRAVGGISIGFGTEDHDAKVVLNKIAEEIVPEFKLPADKPHDFVEGTSHSLLCGICGRTEGWRAHVHVHLDRVERSIVESPFLPPDENLYTPLPGRPYGISDEQLTEQMRQSHDRHGH